MTNLENQYLKEDREAFKELITSMGYVSHEFYSKYEMNIAFEVWQAAKSHYLSERNECVEEIRRLRGFLSVITAYKNTSNGRIIDEALSVTSPTIERLLKESN